MKFSVSIIAKNEEKTLPNLINSLKGVDEILLCDTGSTDKTVEVAKSLGVKVFEQKFDEVIDKETAEKINDISKKNKEPTMVNEGDVIFNFGKARNWIAGQARNDMIFCPDCDEVVDWDIEKVEKALEQRPDKVNYKYNFSFDKNRNPICSFVHCKFYNKKRIEWIGVIHEYLGEKNKDKYKSQIEGWMSDKEMLFLHNSAKEMKTIVEIGSWKGRSTEALLSGCKGTVYAVDHFLGSKGESEQHKEATGDVVYNQFMKNVGHFPNLKVLRMSSEDAVKQFEDKSIDMVFIDGEHTYEGVKKDIELWLPKAKKLICGHDYCDAWQGVKEAVMEKLGKRQTEDSIWINDLDEETRGPIRELDIPSDVILLNHYQNKETNRSKYLIALAFDSIQTNYNDRNCHYFGRELMYTKRYKTAIDILEKHISRLGWKMEQSQSMVYIGNCYLSLGNEEEAKKYFAWSQVSEPNRREPYIALADFYTKKKLWKEAERLYRLCLDIPKNSYYGNIEPNYTHYPIGMLSVCLFYQGRKSESLAYLKEAIALDMNNEVYKKNLTYY